MDASVCCYEIGEGCTKVEPFPPEFVYPSECLTDDCSACGLTYYDATNYYSGDTLTRRIIDYDGGLSDDLFDTNTCCAAGIQLMDPDLL